MSNSVLGILVLVFLLLVAGFCSEAYAGSIDSPIAHWTFDEASGTTAYDSAGSNNGTLVNGVARVAGKIGGALNFDGTNDYVNVLYNSVFQLPVLTMTAWIRPSTDLSVSGGGIVGRGEDSTTDHSAFGMGVRTAASEWGHGVGVGYETNSDADYTYSTNYYPQTSQWTHIAASRDSSGKISIYANGNLIGQFNSTPTPTSECYQDLTIGANIDNNYGVRNYVGFFNGLIDDVRIYDYALSGQEVALLVPEPLTIALLGLGGLMMRKRK